VDHRAQGPRERKVDALTTEETRTRTVRSFEIREGTVESKERAEKADTWELRIDRVKANPGDTIRWEADGGHAISIWFPHTGVFVTPVIAVMHEGPVEATIRDDAPDGVYEYAIYDHTKHKFVTCESHPRIEIPKP
jgi:plastocyanin